MKQYEFRIEPLPAETIDATVERFNVLGAEGWRAVGKYSLNHLLFERETSDEATPHFHLQPNHGVEQVGRLVKVFPCPT